MPFILDGRETSALLLKNLQQEVLLMQQAYNVTPGLAIVHFGHDPASEVYVKAKLKCAKNLGIKAQEFSIDGELNLSLIQELVASINADPEFHGIIIQLPLPQSLEVSKAVNYIHPSKDVDGLTVVNQGQLFANQPGFYPCTPLGVCLLLQRYNINVAGKKVVIIGRSNLVGKPMFHMMLAQDATVSICHFKTENLAEYTLMADVVISAVGKPGLIKEGMLKPGCVVVDVGISRHNNKLLGDVDQSTPMLNVASITPVPGGVGPMTVACLMYNTVVAAAQQSDYALQVIASDPLRSARWN